MTNSDRNIRTLIVCFVISIFALVPLRFVEEGQLMDAGSGSASVLGATTEEKIILPNSEIDESEVVMFEAPYDKEINCLTEQQADVELSKITEMMSGKLLDNKSIEELEDKIEEIVNNVCK